MRSDLELLKDVTEELRYEPSVDEKGIGVAVANGVLTLNGHVPSYAQKLAAEHAVERVTGVRAVTDELMVKLPAAKARTDTHLAAAAAHALTWDTDVPGAQVKARVANGWLTLEGTVERYFQREAAERAVRFLAGVKGVTNLIALSPNALVSDVQQRIEDAITRSAKLDAERITVEARGSAVTLRGSVRSWVEREEAERAAWAASGVTAVDDRIVVKA